MRLDRLGFAMAAVNLALLVFLLARGGPADPAPATPTVLRTQLIELVDTSGTVRAQLRTENGGGVVFRLFDQSGTIRVKLGADERSSGLLLADDTTDVGVHILSGVSALTHERSTMITLADPGGAKRIIRPGAN